MRAKSLILACAFLFAGASVAGSSEGSLPGIGTFTYLDTTLADAHSMPDAISFTCAAK
ncbi:hypothetical protein [Rhodopseudomonas palustris]|nr:hypothetical protein [Rhodopseudomonas palustris]